MASWSFYKLTPGNPLEEVHPDISDDLGNFVSGVIGDISEGEKNQFRDEKNDIVPRLSKKIIESNGVKLPTLSKQIAQNLLTIMNKAEIKQSGLKGNREYVTKPGCLLQYLEKNESGRRYILLKVDSAEFFGLETYKHTRGVPEDKSQIHFSCVLTYDNDSQLNSVLVGASVASSKVSNYWKEFLCCEPVSKSTDNTKLAIRSTRNLIRRVLPNDLKECIEDAMRVYMSSNDDYHHESFTLKLESNIPPARRQEKAVENFFNSLKKLPVEKGYDSQFATDREVVQKSKKRNIEIISGATLVLTTSNEELADTITPNIQGGRKGVMVFSDSLHEMFASPEE